MNPVHVQIILGAALLVVIFFGMVSITPSPEQFIQTLTEEAQSTHNYEMWRYVVPENNELTRLTPWAWEAPDPTFAEKVTNGV